MNEPRNFPNHMLSEIHEHPRAVRDTLAGRLSPESGKISLESLPLGDQPLLAWIRIVGSGTSRYAGLYGKFVIEELAGVPVEVEYASELELLKSPIMAPLTVVTSQSGETSDTLACLRKAKQQGSRTVAICNVQNSSMMREADGALLINAGPELSIPSTKAFGGQLICFLLLALGLAQRKRSLDDKKLGAYISELQQLPEKLKAVLELEDRCAQIAGRFSHVPDFTVFGRGPHFPIALDGALKLKEAAYIHAEGYPGGELKHGQITLMDDQIVAVMLATCDRRDPASIERYQRQLSTAREIRALAGHVIALATEGDQEVARVADETLLLPTAPELLAPNLEIIPLELLAYFIALRRGLNPDKPRNLHKAVIEV